MLCNGVLFSSVLFAHVFSATLAKTKIMLAWPSVGSIGTEQLLLSNLSRCISSGMREILHLSNFSFSQLHLSFSFREALLSASN